MYVCICSLTLKITKKNCVLDKRTKKYELYNTV